MCMDNPRSVLHGMVGILGYLDKGGSLATLYMHMHTVVYPIIMVDDPRSVLGWSLHGNPGILGQGVA